MAAAARAGPQAAAAGGKAPAARHGRVAMLSRPAPARLVGAASTRRRHQRGRLAAAAVGGDNESSSIRTTTTTEPTTGGRRPARQQQQRQQQHEPQLSSSSAKDDENPLELLRGARDPQRRAALMQRATGTGGGWRAWAESYHPLAVELLLCRELGVGSSEAMMLAVGNPALAAAFPDPAPVSADDDQDASSDATDDNDNPRLAPARRALRALRGAGLADADAWFAVSRRPSLLAHPPSLQRWLDLLSLYEARPADVVSFLTRAPDALLRPEEQQQQQDDQAVTSDTDQQTEPTFSEAQAVARYLTSELRLPRDELARRVLCARPALLARDVQRDLVPLHEFAERELGFSLTEWGRVVLACPELLAEATVARHLRPFLDFCREQLGASPQQAGALLSLSPRLPLGQPPAAAQAPDAPATPISHADSDGSLDACPAAGALAPRLGALEELAGVGRPGSERLWQLTAAAAAAAASGGNGGSGLEWLATPGAPEAQLRALARCLGASREDLGRLAVACPALLSQRPDELARRVGWLALAAAEAEGEEQQPSSSSSSSSKAARRRAALALALAHPHVLVAPLRRLAAPRLAFALATERGDGAALTPAAAREAGRRAATAALEGEEEAAEEQDEGQEVEAAEAGAVSFSRLPDLTALVAPNADDVAWVAGLRTLLPPPPPEAGSPLPLPVAAASPSSSSVFAAATAPSRLASAYVAFRAEFDRGYAEAVADASTAELRKLGIVEGSGGLGAAAR